MSCDLPLQAKSFANDLGCLIQNLGKVAAAFTLDENCRGYNLHVLQGHAGDQIVERRLQLQTIVHLIEGQPELSAHRLLALTRNQAHGGIETVTDAESTHDEVDGFGKALLKLAQPHFALLVDVEKRRASCNNPHRQTDDDQVGSPIDQICGHYEANAAEKAQSAYRPLHIRLIQKAANTRRQLQF